MADKDKKDDDKAPIIIVKRIKKVGGHHGGAWKIALADFMTAMFCFFLVMWIVGSVSEETKKGLAEYFSPVISSRSGASGAGGILGGQVLSKDGGAMNSDSASSTGNKFSDAEEKKKKEEAAMDAADDKAFEGTSEAIKDELTGFADLANVNDNIVIDITHEGLRIQILDKDGKEMFKSGSAEPQPQTIEILKIISKIVQELPNKISIRGHTDATPFVSKTKDNYTNWELSADRANTTRRIMMESGIDEKRIQDVQGKAATVPFDVSDPNSSRNRRVSLIILRQTVVKHDADKSQQYYSKSKVKKREEGVIYFP